MSPGNRMPFEAQWTPREDEVLMRVYSGVEACELADRFRRTANAIWHRARRLGARKRSVRPWCADELAIIAEPISSFEAACRVGRSVQSVVRKRQRMRRDAQRAASRRFWSPAEDARLVELWGRSSVDIAPEIPGRTPKAIRARAREIGLPGIKSR